MNKPKNIHKAIAASGNAHLLASHLTNPFGGDEKACLDVMAGPLDVNYVSFNLGNRSLLMLATAAGYTRVVRALLQHGADAGWKNPRGMTAIDFASGAEKDIIAKMIQKKNQEQIAAAFRAIALKGTPRHRKILRPPRKETEAPK
ncbi:MAG: ankyrin repeat domain-containing protein [Alphaproteobacteria bacterium]|nr:ankyrin repeat domain-containing protein [Alphaproteobacteria bacterium]